MNSNSTFSTSESFFTFTLFTFNKHIGERIIAVEILVRRIGKCTHSINYNTISLNKFSVLGQINRSKNDESFRLTAFYPNTSIPRDTQATIFIDRIFEIANSRRNNHIRNIDNGHIMMGLDNTVNLAVRRIDGNKERLIALDTLSYNVKRILQSELFHIIQNRHQRSTQFDSKGKRVVVFISKKLCKNNLQSIDAFGQFHLRSSLVIWRKHNRRVICRRIIRAFRVTRACRANGRFILNRDIERSLHKLFTSFTHRRNGNCTRGIFINSLRSENEFIRQSRVAFRLRQREQSRRRNLSYNRNHFVFTCGKDFLEVNL